MRALIFSVWVTVGKTAPETIAALEALAAKQYTVAQDGGRQMISASVQGKNFSYEIPEGQSAASVSAMAYEGWKALLNCDGKVMSDEELEAYLKDCSGEVTNTTRVRFSYGGRY